MTQFGFKTETTVGTTVTPDLFLPILDGESLDRTDPIMESEGLRAGALVKRMGATNGGLNEVGGSTPFELSVIGATTLFKHMLGAVNTSGSDPYTHVFTPASLMSLAATLQVGVNMNGTVVPKTVSGAKVGSWAIGGEEGAFLTLGLDWLAQRLQVGSRSVTDGVTSTPTRPSARPLPTSPMPTSARTCRAPGSLPARRSPRSLRTAHRPPCRLPPRQPRPV